MGEKFKNKYRIDTLRLKNWDYGSDASYFITFCTKNRTHFFGKIEDKTMLLSPMGQIAYSLFNEIPDRFPYVSIDAMVIMPDHVHGVLTIDKMSDFNTDSNTDSNPDFNPNSNPTCWDSCVGGAINRASTGPKQDRGGITKNNNPMLHDNISRVIRWYKGRTTFECRKINPDFEWQSRFYDHIIRNNFAYQNIVKYVEDNPEKWRGR